MNHDIGKRLWILSLVLLTLSALYACGGKNSLPPNKPSSGSGPISGGPPAANGPGGPVPAWEKRGPYEVAGVFLSADGSKVFTSLGRQFVALNGDDGSIIWQYLLPEDHEVDDFKAAKAGNTVLIAHRFSNVAKGGGEGDCETADPLRDAARILDGASGSVLASIHKGYDLGCNGYLWNGSVSRNGSFLQLVRSENVLTAFDVYARDGTPRWEAPTGGSAVRDFALSSNGSFVSGQGQVSTLTGAHLFYHFPPDEPGATYFAQFSPDEQYLLTSFYRQEATNVYTELWTTSGTRVWSHEAKLAYIAAISNAARHIAVVEPGGIAVYNAQGDLLFMHDLGFPPWVGQMEITPDGRYLAVAAQKGRDFIENPANPGVGDALGWGSVEAQFLVLDLDAEPANRVRWQASFGDIGIPYISISDDGSRVAVGGLIGFVSAYTLPAF